jgi:hypothetical protein
MALERLEAEQHYPRYYEPSEVIDFRGFSFCADKIADKTWIPLYYTKQ